MSRRRFLKASALIGTSVVAGAPGIFGARARPARQTRAGGPIRIIMGGYGPSTTSFSRGLKFIGDRLEARFGDEVEVRYVYNVIDVGYSGGGDLRWLVDSGVLALAYLTMSTGVSGVGGGRTTVLVLRHRRGTGRNWTGHWDRRRKPGSKRIRTSVYSAISRTAFATYRIASGLCIRPARPEWPFDSLPWHPSPHVRAAGCRAAHDEVWGLQSRSSRPARSMVKRIRLRTPSATDPIASSAITRRPSTPICHDRSSSIGSRSTPGPEIYRRK